MYFILSVEPSSNGLFLEQIPGTSRVPNVPGSGNLVSLRPAAAGASKTAGVRANRVRTRVRPQTKQQSPVTAEEGPPSFALTTDEDIQRLLQSFLVP